MMKMKVITVGLLALGAAIVSTIPGRSVSAQDSTTKPRSTIPIKVSKESPGEVALPPRVDTVTLFHTDTVTLNGRIDTVTTTVTRYDTVTVTVATPAPILPMSVAHFPNGVYFGLGAGTSEPSGSLFNPYSMGGTAQMQVGYQRSFWGLRVDGNYMHPGEDSQYSGLGPDPDIVNLNGDLKLDVPLNHMFGITPRFSLYGIGGASYSSFRNLAMTLDDGIPGGYGTADVSLPNPNWQHEWGWNAGGGMAFSFNRTQIFVEARAIAFNTSINPTAYQVPIVFGMNWFGSDR
jgi:hypothetical protein